MFFKTLSQPDQLFVLCPPTKVDRPPAVLQNIANSHGLCTRLHQVERQPAFPCIPFAYSSLGPTSTAASSRSAMRLPPASLLSLSLWPEIAIFLCSHALLSLFTLKGFRCHCKTVRLDNFSIFILTLAPSRMSLIHVVFKKYLLAWTALT